MRRRLETSWKTDRRRAGGRHYGWLLLLLGVLLLSMSVLWAFRDRLRSPRALFEEAQRASPKRAAVLYERLAERLPQIEEYAQLWAAEDAMPDLINRALPR